MCHVGCLKSIHFPASLLVGKSEVDDEPKLRRRKDPSLKKFDLVGASGAYIIRGYQHMAIP